MDNESITLSTKEPPEGIKRIQVNINLRREVFEYLDQCFQLINLSWDEFVQEQIEDAIEGLKDSGHTWLGEQIQARLKQI